LEEEFVFTSLPPRFENDRLHIHSSGNVFRALRVGPYAIWHGIPKLSVTVDNRIIITAEKTEDNEERVVRFDRISEDCTVLNMQDRANRYRQIQDFAGIGLAFQRVTGLPIYDDEFLVKFGGPVPSFHGHRGRYIFDVQYDAHKVGELFTNLPASMVGDPQLRVSDDLSRLYIEPKPQSVWEYSIHAHRAGILSVILFIAKPIRLRVPAGDWLNEPVWHFPMVTDSSAVLGEFRFDPSTKLDEKIIGPARLVFSKFVGEWTAGFEEIYKRGVPELVIADDGSLRAEWKTGDNENVYTVKPVKEFDGEIAIRISRSVFSKNGAEPFVVNEQEDRCPVCLEYFSVGETVARTVNCKHRMHLNCLIQTVRMSGRASPLCRAEIRE
jgi:hypothetical protein